MNLLINAEALRPPITGIGNYTFHLLEQMVELNLVESVDCFTGTQWCSAAQQLAVSDEIRNASLDASVSPVASAIATLREWVGKVPGTQRAYDAVMDGRFARHANSIGDALYHETNYILKPFSGPCVTTVHDLSHIRFPDYHPEHVVSRLNKLLPESLDRADAIVTVSDLVRDELLDHFDLEPAKVVTIYEGVDGHYAARTAQETASTLGKYALAHTGYVFSAATLEPRKGIDTLLDAWQSLPDELCRQCPLVLVGSTGWRNDGLKERIATLSERGTVKHLGYVPAQDLPLLFAGARVFSYPSVYEGFGLPVLDAMRSGVPVVCRSGTSMAEFADGACLLCDTASAEELAQHLRSLIEDDALRREWAQRGLARSHDFSWSRCARETAALYQRIS